MKPHNRSIGGPCWGTKNSNKYHYPTCKSAQRIKPANLVRFKSPGRPVRPVMSPVG